MRPTDHRRIARPGRHDPYLDLTSEFHLFAPRWLPLTVGWADLLATLAALALLLLMLLAVGWSALALLEALS